MNEVKFHPVSSVPFQLDVRPVRASNMIPEWYKQQPFGDDKPSATIKRCMPILDMMSAGYMYVMPADVWIDATNPNFLDFGLQDESIRSYTPQILTDHQHYQYDHYPIDPIYHKEVMRVNPLWAIETPPGYSTLFIEPTHRYPTPIKAIPGIIDTDSFASSGFLSFNVLAGFKGIVKQGTPLIQMIPFLREDWESKWGSVTIDNMDVIKEQHKKLKHSDKKHAYRDMFRKIKRW